MQGGGETEAISKEELNLTNSPPSFHWPIYNERIHLLCLNVSKQHIFCNNNLKLYAPFLIYLSFKNI